MDFSHVFGGTNGSSLIKLNEMEESLLLMLNILTNKWGYPAGGRMRFKAESSIRSPFNRSRKAETHGRYSASDSIGDGIAIIPIVSFYSEYCGFACTNSIGGRAKSCGT
jgi:hypothetical protein